MSLKQENAAANSPYATNSADSVLVALVGASLCAAMTLKLVRSLASSNGKPPGRVLNALNCVLHSPVVEQLVDSLFWSAVCCAAFALAPCIFFYKLIRAGQEAYLHLFPRECIPEGRAALAIVITGCDSGFGHALVMELWYRGYTVIAGCLLDSCVERLTAATKSAAERMIAVRVDVTSDFEVDSAVEASRKWLRAGSAEGRRRLLAVVCNAGVGTGGLADWLRMSDFERDFAVNLFGVVRVSKAFLPLLKEGARELSRGRKSRAALPARLIVVSSMAGKVPVPMLAPYTASKHACAALAACLRMELACFGIAVTTICPSFHLTPLLATCTPELDRVWDRTSPALREEYGNACFASVKTCAQQMMTDWAWDPQRVTDALASAATSVRWPPCEVVVGADARYALLALRLLPVALSEKVVWVWQTWWMTAPHATVLDV